MPTRYLINGRPVTWDDGNRSRLRLGALEPVCAATLLSLDDAVRRAITRIRGFYAVFGGGLVLVFVVLFLVARGHPDSGFFLTMLGIAALVITGVAVLLYPSKISNARARIASAQPPGPPGSTMRADDRGLAIEGRGLLPWSALKLVTADMLRMPVRDGAAYYLVRSLVLTASDDGAPVVLDPILFDNPRAFLDNVFQRLRSADRA